MKIRRLEEFTNELNTLREKAEAAQLPVTPGLLGISGDGTGSTSKASTGLISRSSFGEAEAASLRWLSIDNSQETQWRSLELINLPPETVLELLSHFEQYYFPHLPILEPIESTSDIFEKSPLLFWTIMLVSCQWHPTLSYLYQQMIAPHGG